MAVDAAQQGQCDDDNDVNHGEQSEGERSESDEERQHGGHNEGEWTDEDGEYGGDTHEPVKRGGKHSSSKTGQKDSSLDSSEDCSDGGSEESGDQDGPGLSFEFSSDEEGSAAEDDEASAAHKAVAPFLAPPPKAFFRAELSPFNFLWSLCSAWITRDTIAYLTSSTPSQQPPSAHQQQQQAEDKESEPAAEPTATTSSPPPSLHTHSRQARTALSGLLEPHLHRLLRALHAHSYSGEVEKRVSHVLNTLVFPGPIPSLNVQQWNLLTLALLRALSLGCMPGLAGVFEGPGVDLGSLLASGLQEDCKHEPMFSLPHLSALLDLLLHD